MSSKTQSYKNTEVKGRVNERIENVLIDSGKLSQSLTKNSKTREVFFFLDFYFLFHFTFLSLLVFTIHNNSIFMLII